jgi:hypothetical protein
VRAGTAARWFHISYAFDRAFDYMH